MSSPYIVATRVYSSSWSSPDNEFACAMHLLYAVLICSTDVAFGDTAEFELGFAVETLVLAACLPPDCVFCALPPGPPEPPGPPRPPCPVDGSYS
eukprot:887094-Amphidinium_carterae.1